MRERGGRGKKKKDPKTGEVVMRMIIFTNTTPYYHRLLATAAMAVQGV